MLGVANPQDVQEMDTYAQPYTSQESKLVTTKDPEALNDK